MVLIEPLHAREAAARHVPRVGPDRHHPLALDIDLEAAQGLADPAKCMLGRHSRSFTERTIYHSRPYAAMPMKKPQFIASTQTSVHCPPTGIELICAAI